MLCTLYTIHSCSIVFNLRKGTLLGSTCEPPQNTSATIHQKVNGERSVYIFWCTCVLCLLFDVRLQTKAQGSPQGALSHEIRGNLKRSPKRSLRTTTSALPHWINHKHIPRNDTCNLPTFYDVTWWLSVFFASITDVVPRVASAGSAATDPKVASVVVGDFVPLCERHPHLRPVPSFILSVLVHFPC